MIHLTKPRALPLVVIFSAACILSPLALADDWPQFRHDAGRTAASSRELPADLQLRWTWTLPAPRPAFPHELRLGFDASYEPVVLGKTLFVPSMVTDSLTALDTETGAVRWRFVTGGPVRFAPAASNGKVCLVSDDGYLYCLNAADGSLRWKFRGLPEDRPDRKVLGNGRLISMFPARGGPVVADGKVYFAAGIWPSEGVFVHAVNIATGKAVWSNTDSGNIPKSNWDHGVGHVSGITPQGYLAIVGNTLVVPCGAQLPAFFDLKTGKRHTYTMGWGGRNGLPKGCWFAAGVGKYLSTSGDLYDITRLNEERLPKTRPGQKDYKPLLYPGGWTRLGIERANQRELDRFSQPVMTPEVMYESDQSIVARDLTGYELQKRTKNNIPKHRAGDKVPDSFGAVIREIWEMPSKLDVHLKAGSRLYAGGRGVVEAINVAEKQPKAVWQAKIEGTPTRMLAAAGKLFVVTAEGRILAFGAPATGQPTHHKVPKASPPAADAWTAKATSLLKAAGIRDGYALVLGLNNGRLVEELVKQSNLHVIAVEGDAKKVAALRDRLLRAGSYGTRASVLEGNPATCPLPPYMASLIVSEHPNGLAVSGNPSRMKALFHVLRPYGGAICVPRQSGRLEETARKLSLHGAGTKQVGDLVLLTRSGSLPGAGDWSHEEANAASTGASKDQLRKPTKILWFDAAHRWHKFPGQNQVRVSGGRLVLLEQSLLQAMDVYTGRKLWEVDLTAENKDHQSIRDARHRQWGPKRVLSSETQLVVVQDAIYLAHGSSCRVLDPATGKETGRIEMPKDLKSPWKNLRVDKEYVVATSGQHVVCMNRRTGKQSWRVKANEASLHLAVGGGKVFCAESKGRIFALDLASGKEVWERQGVGPLRYSKSLDMVVTPKGFYKGADGKPLPWPADAKGKRLVIMGRGLAKAGVPGYVAGGKLLTGGSDSLQVYDLRSAKPVGKALKWNTRGCTGTRASKFLLTTRFRGNSAWVDLDNRQLTPILGIRPACQVNNNLYPADGVLNVPNLTGGCTCNYLPVSTALVPASALE